MIFNLLAHSYPFSPLHVRLVNSLINPLGVSLFYVIYITT